jgi:hypothetical protein
VKVFTKRKVKEFSQCTTAEKAEIFRKEMYINLIKSAKDLIK